MKCQGNAEHPAPDGEGCERPILEWLPLRRWLPAGPHDPFPSFRPDPLRGHRQPRRRHGPQAVPAHRRPADGAAHAGGLPRAGGPLRRHCAGGVAAGPRGGGRAAALSGRWRTPAAGRRRDARGHRAQRPAGAAAIGRRRPARLGAGARRGALPGHADADRGPDRRLRARRGRRPAGPPPAGHAQGRVARGPGREHADPRRQVAGPDAADVPHRHAARCAGARRRCGDRRGQRDRGASASRRCWCRAARRISSSPIPRTSRWPRRSCTAGAAQRHERIRHPRRRGLGRAPAGRRAAS